MRARTRVGVWGRGVLLWCVKHGALCFKLSRPKKGRLKGDCARNDKIHVSNCFDDLCSFGEGVFTTSMAASTAEYWDNLVTKNQRQG